MAYTNTDKGNRSETAEYRDLSAYSLSEAIDEIQDGLNRRGFTMIPRPGAPFSGYDVYAKSSPDIPGIKFPKGFTYQRVLLPWITPDRALFTEALKMTIKEAQHRYQDDEDSGRAFKNLELARVCFTERAADHKNPVSLIAQFRAAQEPVSNISINGTSGSFRFVPLLEWFPEAIQQLDPRDLLTLFPEPEKDSLMLLLGRAVAGADQTETLEGPIQHTARSYGVIVGREPGMGKSTLFGYVIDVMRKLGYKVEFINSNFGKFGWGDIADSDLAYIDDLTEDTQRQMLRDGNIKSLVSNNYLKVEEKGIKGWNIRSRTVILACTNHSDPGYLIGVDPGCLSRLNQLDTYTTFELADRYGVSTDDAKNIYRLRQYWEQTAAKYGVTVEVLAARLLRGALDYFLATTGHYLDNTGVLCKDPNKDRLEWVMNTNRSGYRIDVTLSHASELVRSGAELLSLAIAYDSKRTATLLAKTEKAIFDHRILYHLIEVFYCSDRITEPFLSVCPQQIAANCKTLKLSELQTIAKDKALSDAFTGLITKLTSNKGYGYPKSVSHYQGYWQSQIRLIPGRVQEWKETLEAVEDIPEVLDEILKDVTKVLSNI